MAFQTVQFSTWLPESVYLRPQASSVPSQVKPPPAACKHVVVVVVGLAAGTGAFKLGVDRHMDGGGGAFLVVVAHEVAFMHSAIGRATTPVVDHVVEDVESASVIACRVETTGEAPVAPFVVGEQHVVECAHVAANRTRVAMGGPGRVVLVVRDVQRFGDHGALQGEVLAIA